MQVRVGFEMIYECPRPTPMIFNLNVHFTRVSDLVGRDELVFDPTVPTTAYRDSFGNWCTRVVAPKGSTRVSTDAVVNDTGIPDVAVPDAQQLPVQELPEETLLFLLGSRYCETDRLSETAWQLFGKAPTGWGRVQAICDYVHRHLVFGYEHARMTRTAMEAFYDKTGICRDYTHLAAAFCRCMNIPRRTLVHVRRAQQHAAHRQGADRARPRRVGRCTQQHVRSEYVDELPRVDRRDPHRARIAALSRRTTAGRVAASRW